MHTTLVELHGIVLTPWKLIGYLGVLLFSGRWFVQMLASRKAGVPTVPLLFWHMSLAGSVLCLAYFIFGRNDSVGVLANAFPFAVALYNLRLALRQRSNPRRSTAPSGSNTSAEALQGRSIPIARRQNG